MSEEFDNEMLSAFLDGELSVEEAKTVQAQLDQSELMRSQADQLKAIGSTLRELPSESAPADLAKSIMTALPARPPVAEPVSEPGSGWQRWSGPGAMLVGAAALMLMLKVTTDSSPNKLASKAASDMVVNSIDQKQAPQPSSATVALQPQMETPPQMREAEAGAGLAPMESRVRSAPLETADTFEVVRIAGDEREASGLLTKFLTAQMLEHQRQRRSLEGRTVTTFVVSLDASEVQSMLQKAEAFEDGGLSVLRETSKSVLHQELMASIRLDQAKGDEVASKVKSGDQVIASNDVAGLKRSVAVPSRQSPPAPGKQRSQAAPSKKKAIEEN